MITPDLIAHNGHIVTMDENIPAASAFAVYDDKIIHVGDDADVMAMRGHGTICVDLGGKYVVPGFCDAHIHLFWYGNLLISQADLVGCDRIDAILERLSAHAAQRAGGWIRGHGFDQEKLVENRFPTRSDLDKVSTIRPILISRICGHAVVVNSAALALVTAADRARGDVDTGLYTENDSAPFYGLMPVPTAEESDAGVLRAQEVLLRTGITSVQTLLDTPDQMAAYARLRRAGLLKIRVCGMSPQSAVETLQAHGINTTFGDEWVRFGAAKLFSDGSMGARTALLAAPYSDDDNPENVGIRIYPPAELNARAKAAHDAGFQVAIHAIGDQAVRESLDALEFALDGADNDFHRHRIEHVSLLPSDLCARMAALKIVAVVQPQFVTSDVWTGDRVGVERSVGAYPFRMMREAGIPLALSSDCPVETPNAWACLAAATGRAAWSPDETLSAHDAIWAYTMGSHHAAHFEHKAGSLSVGKFADFVVLSENPLALRGDEFRRVRAEMVYVGGKRVTHDGTNL